MHATLRFIGIVVIIVAASSAWALWHFHEAIHLKFNTDKEYFKAVFSAIPTMLASLTALIVSGGIGVAQLQIARQQRDIADQQKRIASKKLRADIYDKRFTTFCKLQNLEKEFQNTVPQGLESLLKLLSMASEIGRLKHEFIFLFGDDILPYVEQVREIIIDTWRKLEGEIGNRLDGNYSLSDSARKVLLEQRNKLSALQEKIPQIFYEKLRLHADSIPE